MAFPDTRWTLLAHAARSGEAGAKDAMAEFYRQYRAPVLEFVSRRQPSGSDNEDVVHAFFVHLLDGEALSRADATRGRFRSYLLGALMRFLSHERERSGAQKRGGGVKWVDMDAAAASGEEPAVDAQEMEAYDRAWALQILTRALEALEAEYAQKERMESFAVLKQFLPGAVPPVPSYEEAVQTLGVGMSSFKTEVHRIRNRLRDLLRREVAATVASPTDVDEEVSYLGRVLAAQIR